MSNDDKTLHEKLDKLDTRLDRIDITLVRQEMHLDEHMRRTDLLETVVDEFKIDMRPVKRHVIVMEGVTKGIGIIATLVGIVGGFLKILGVF